MKDFRNRLTKHSHIVGGIGTPVFNALHDHLPVLIYSPV